MANEKGKPKSIILGSAKYPIPDRVWERICKQKRDILNNNPTRSDVSHHEAIYKLILNNCG